MKLKHKAKPHLINDWLAEIVPVVEDRSSLKVKIRLLFNYFMESLVLIAVMLSVCLEHQIQIVYVEYTVVALRILLYILSIKLNIVDMAIAIKILIIVGVFTVTTRESIIIEAILLVIHLLFAAKLALSCEQRRGNFDERLGVTIPFFK